MKYTLMTLLIVWTLFWLLGDNAFLGFVLGVAAAYPVGKWQMETQGTISIFKWINQKTQSPAVEPLPAPGLGTTYRVSALDAMAAVKNVLTFSHKGPHFWKIRHLDANSGVIQAALQFEEYTLRYDNRKAECLIVLVAHVTASQVGTTVRLDWEVQTKFGGEKSCKNIVQQTAAAIEREIRGFSSV